MTQLDPQYISKRFMHLFETMLSDKVKGEVHLLDEFFENGVLADAKKDLLLAHYFTWDETLLNDKDAKIDRANLMDYFVEYIKTRSPNPQERAEIFLPKYDEKTKTLDWSHGDVRANILKLANHVTTKTLQAKKIRNIARAATQTTTPAPQKTSPKSAEKKTDSTSAVGESDSSDADDFDGDFDTVDATDVTDAIPAPPTPTISSGESSPSGASAAIDFAPTPTAPTAPTAATPANTASTTADSASPIPVSQPLSPPSLHNAVSTTELAPTYGDWGNGGGETGGGGASGSYDLPSPVPEKAEQYTRVPGKIPSGISTGLQNPASTLNLHVTEELKLQLPQQRGRRFAPKVRGLLNRTLDKAHSLAKPPPVSGTVQANKYAQQQQQAAAQAQAKAGSQPKAAQQQPGTSQASQINTNSPKKPSNGAMKKVLAILGVNVSLIGTSVVGGLNLGDDQTINIAMKTIKEFWLAFGHYLPNMFG